MTVTPFNTGLSPYIVRHSSAVSHLECEVVYEVLTPHLPSISGGIRFGLARFRSPLLTGSLLLSLPLLIRMFCFSRFPYPWGYNHRFWWLRFAFGDPRIEDYSRLPGAYRSLSRPSSASKPRHPLYGVFVVSLRRVPSRRTSLCRLRHTPGWNRQAEYVARRLHTYTRKPI